MQMPVTKNLLPPKNWMQFYNEDPNSRLARNLQRKTYMSFLGPPKWVYLIAQLQTIMIYCNEFAVYRLAAWILQFAKHFLKI